MSDKDQLKDSQYDGIQEYDNDLPKWWVGTFVVTVACSFLYWFYFYSFNGPSQTEKYTQAYEKHQSRYANQNKVQGISDELLLSMLASKGNLDKGKTIYTQNCVACHAASGGGGIGPNLTDSYWIHEGTPMGIYKTIHDGVVEKGMLAWKDILTSSQMQQVAVYVISMKNTNVAGGKDPQGENIQE